MDNRVVKTITIPNGGFRNVTLTKEEFIARWLEHVSHFYGLSYNQLVYNKVIEFASFIENVAAEKFEEIYIKQTSQRIVCHNTLVGGK